MKHSKILVFLLLVSTTYAQNSWSLKAGINFSKFRDSNSDIMTNYAFGIAKNIQIKERFFLSPEILITRKGSILGNKPVKNEDWEWYLYSNDIIAKQIYLEIPLLFGYKTTISGNSVKFYIGPSFTMVLSDETELTNSKIIYDDDHPERMGEFENYDFEFVQGDYGGLLPFKEPGSCLNAGVVTTFNKLSAEMRYSYSLNRIGQIGQLNPIDRYLHAFYILLGYYL